jgi:hypothetical protein
LDCGASTEQGQPCPPSPEHAGDAVVLVVNPKAGRIAVENFGARGHTRIEVVSQVATVRYLMTGDPVGIGLDFPHPCVDRKPAPGSKASYVGRLLSKTNSDRTHHLTQPSLDALIAAGLEVVK